MKKEDLFDKNLAIIVSSNGDIKKVEEKESEKYHYQAFERFNDNIGIMDTLIIDNKAYNGYELSLKLASMGNTIFTKLHPKQTNEIILAIPSIISKEQYDMVEKILESLNDSVVYLYISEKKENKDLLFAESIASYLMSKGSDKSLDEIKEISIIERKSNFNKK